MRNEDSSVHVQPKVVQKDKIKNRKEKVEGNKYLKNKQKVKRKKGKIAWVVSPSCVVGAGNKTTKHIIRKFK